MLYNLCMIKIAFFDIDGTLIPKGENNIPISTLKALEKLQASGVKCFVATGRSLNVVMSLGTNQFNFDGYLTLNGALCYDSHLEKIFGLPFEGDEAEVIARMFIAKKIPFEIVGEFVRYANFVNDSLKDVYNSLNINIPSIQKYKGEKIYQVCAIVNKNQRKLLNDFLDYSVITSWHEHGIDIFPSNGGKQNAIRKILEIFNIKTAEAIAFGDAENDIKMLETVGTGIAMGNANQELKDIADYVTTDINDDGIANALKHFGLID